MKTLLCDIGNVLLFFSHFRGFEQMGKVLGVDPHILYKEMVEHELDVRYEIGEISTELLCNYFKSLATRTHTPEELIHAWCDIFTPNNALLPVIGALKALGIRLVLISNICDSHHQYIFTRFPFLKSFDDGIFSFQVKAIKPSPLIFEKALKVANCKPSECFYIDDVKEYVDAARTHDIDAEQYLNMELLMNQLKTRGINLFSK